VSQIQEAARITLPHVTLRTDKQTSPKPTHGINPIRIEPPPNNKIFIIIISIVIERKNARIPETICRQNRETEDRSLLWKEEPPSNLFVCPFY
jgi:hypothetical protein